MLAPVTSPTPIRLVAPAIPQEVCAGAPSCGPLLQHELLKAIRHRAPQTYLRITRELSLNLEKTQFLVRRGNAVSAARAIQIAQLITREQMGCEILGQAGYNLLAALYRELPLSLKLLMSSLPRPLRIRLALAIVCRIAHTFAGSNCRILTRRYRGRLYVMVVDGIFSDRPETLAGAHEFYRRALESMFKHFAKADCQLSVVKPGRVSLNRCCFEIAWKA